MMHGGWEVKACIAVAIKKKDKTYHFSHQVSIIESGKVREVLHKTGIFFF